MPTDTTSATPTTSTPDPPSWIATYGWIVAVLIVLVGSVISNFGLNLQKLALNVTESKQKKTIMWLIGISCVVLGSFADFFALAYGAQSIVAPLGSMTVVSNVFLAPIMQGETVTRKDLTYTGIIISGCVITVMFASHTQADYTLEQLFAFYGTSAFRTWIFLIISILCSVVYAIRHIEMLEKSYGDTHRFYVKYQKFHRFSYAAISGIAGAQSVLFAKLLVSLIKASLGGKENMLLDPYSYLVLLAMLGSIFLQVYWLNCGLARWDALYNVPIFQSFWISFSELGGGVVYGEFYEFTAIQGFMFFCGSMVTVWGVYLLSTRNIESKPSRSEPSTQSTSPTRGNAYDFMTSPDSVSAQSRDERSFLLVTGAGSFNKLNTSEEEFELEDGGDTFNSHIVHRKESSGLSAIPPIMNLIEKQVPSKRGV